MLTVDRLPTASGMTSAETPGPQETRPFGLNSLTVFPHVLPALSRASIHPVSQLSRIGEQICIESPDFLTSEAHGTDTSATPWSDEDEDD
jgi:putative ATP-grasp target RiPP